MLEKKPRVTVGMPVYNGENYIAEAIESILAQTFTDFELIISDNASTDETAVICQRYAEQDERIRFIRNEENLGASPNYNLLVDLAQGEYFKWSAHDDVCHPEMLEKLVPILDANDEVVIAYALSQAIDENGKVIKDFRSQPNLNSPKVATRFYNCVVVPHSQNAVFGLMRTAVLAASNRIGNYSSSDRTLLGELILVGRFYEIEEPLFFKRHHADQHWRTHKSYKARAAWYDPKNAQKKRVYRTWRLLREHLTAIGRAPLSVGEKLQCYGLMVWWLRYQGKKLLVELVPQIGLRAQSEDHQRDLRPQKNSG